MEKNVDAVNKIQELGTGAWDAQPSTLHTKTVP